MFVLPGIMRVKIWGKNYIGSWKLQESSSTLEKHLMPWLKI
jgi:hypothetical protein